MSARYIAHLDMGAFYASVELLRYPQLRGQPTVVGGRRRTTAPEGMTFPRLRDYTGRGVITTATYEARALGVHSGMGLMKAAKLAPDAWLLLADFDQYRHYSRLFKQTVRAIAVSTPKRLKSLLDVPAVAEVLPGFEVVGWYGLVGPAKLSKPILAKIHAETAAYVKSPDFMKRAAADGAEPVGNDPETFRLFMLADLKKWAEVVKRSGAKFN